ncbi:conserved hypothetical protein [Bradyrhizobium sp. ORS 375]|uniref:DUF72 domain-containing protein n=1 Tax=Bradyrhizobium sp. (strain ORS 375) TaxID=566679 RepID=UPI0002405D79|nr:DUF72 domain-containing protein [Bradyrhizobium sp. ORS 375]CCD92401.1 conserved hypothetical protein [Bradyrhizobium sp. ORS 375]
MARVVVGTSGWHYDSWRGPFFPPGLLIKHQLRYYASQFETTELNGVFYRTPTEAAVRGWRDQTGPDFVFAWKASKFITHWKRLSERSVNSLELMESRLKLLGDKAGPVLFQLPPQFEADHDRLASFLRLVPRHRRYSFEFRHSSWYTPPIIKLLREANVSLCLSDHHDAPAPWRRTADFVYVRGHGPGGRYKDNYPAATLKAWAKRIRTWSAHGIDVFVYFDNDQKSAAPADALQLRALLDGPRSRSRAASRRSSAEHRTQLSV